jgi:arsenite methyltransferase
VRTRFAGWSKSEVEAALERLARTRDRVLEGAGISSGEKVVDVGAGTGLLALGAAERVGPDGDVLAVEVSADALEEFRRVARAPNIAYLIGIAEVLPLPNESVEVVATRSVLIYVDDKPTAEREFFRVLRPGGRVSLFEPINSKNLRLVDAVDFTPLGELGERLRHWNEAAYADADDPMLNFDEEDLVRGFTDAGFADVRAELDTLEHEMQSDRYLNSVGAPGRPTLLQRWRNDFDPPDVERLVEFLRDRLIPIRYPHVYLTARKP